ncbi:hypothetical protein Hte_002061 [Hypoxylon texense]
MPPSSSNNSTVRLPRPPEEHRRRKRYSLRIEFLDDDEEEELNRAREASDRRSGRPGSARETSTVRNRERAEPGPPRASDRRSRRASTSSTAAVVGRHPSPLSGPESPQGVSQRQGIRQQDIRQLSEGVNPMSLRDPEEAAALPELLQQMSIHGRESGSRRERTDRRNATTQTSIRGYDPRSTATPPPYRPSARHHHSHNRSLESAYFDGFLMGQRLANAHQQAYQRPPTVRNTGAGVRDPPTRPHPQRPPGIFRILFPCLWRHRSY